MIYVALYILALAILAISYKIVHTSYMRKLHVLYDLFDQYIASYTADILSVKKLLYHEKQWVDILMTNLHHFFGEQYYTSAVFKRYTTLFTEDYTYLLWLFPEQSFTAKDITFSTYSTLMSVEKNRTVLEKALDILTLSLWRIFIR